MALRLSNKIILALLKVVPAFSDSFRLFLLAVLTFCFCAYSSTAFASDQSKPSISTLIREVRLGEISLEELADSLITAAENRPAFSSELESAHINFPDFDKILGPKLVSRVRQFLIKHQPDDAAALKALGRKVLGFNNSHYRSVVSLCSVVERAETVKASGGEEALAQFLMKKRLPDEQSLLLARYSDVLSARATNISEEENSFVAVQKLVQVDSLTPSEENKEKLVKLLESISQGIEDSTLSADDWTFDHSLVRGALEDLMKTKPETQDLVLSIFSWRALRCIAEDDPKGAHRYFSFIVKSRVDPSRKNDELRLAMAMGATGPNAKRYVRNRLAELKDSEVIGKMQRLELMMEGYYGSGMQTFSYFAVFGFFAVIFAGMWVFRPRGVFLGSPGSKYRKYRDAKRGVRYTEVTTSDDEYSELLSFFGLSDEATEGQIKKAFRQAVKECHPDTQGASGVAYDSAGNVDETFQDLRKKYNRLLEIRSGWFGKR